MKNWCGDNDICEATFYKWQKKVFEIVNHEETYFVEVTPLTKSGSTIAVIVKIARAEADIHSGADKV